MSDLKLTRESVASTFTSRGPTTKWSHRFRRWNANPQSAYLYLHG